MARNLFLYVTNHNLISYPWEENTFGEAAWFAHGGEDKGRFLEYLDSFAAGFTAYILTDLTEEEIKQERVPRLNPFNRSQMLEHRAQRLLRNTPFRHVQYLGRDSQVKTQDNVLFSGLTDPETTLLAWVNILLEKGIPLAGIWSLPLLTPRVFHSVIDAKHKNVLLSSINTGGLRQTFMRDGQIQISRLSPVPTLETEKLVPFLHGEVARMMGYLSSQRLLAWGSEMHVYILCDQALIALLNAGPREVSNHHLHPVDVAVLTNRVGLKNTLEAGKMDRLFGHYIIRRHLPNHYARPLDIAVFHSMQLRQQVRWLAAGMAGVGLLAGTILFFQARADQERLPALLQQVQEMEKKRPSGEVSNQDLTVRDVQRIVEAVPVVETLQKHAMDPLRLLQIVGPILAEHPSLWLNSLEWSVGREGVQPVPAATERGRGGKGGPPGGRAGTPPGGRGSAGAGTGGTLPGSRAAAGTGGSPPGSRGGGAPPGNQGETATERTDYQTGQISGHIHPLPRDAKEALSKVEAFIRDLRTLPEVVEIQPVKMPMNLGQGAVIQGGGGSISGGGAVSADAALFVLKVILATRP
ncbi:MAG: hypothetical protein HQL65_00040 [Magnetococcales bacterium]|nr:hypothetical protein [Magnetococcales bacterium]